MPETKRYRELPAWLYRQHDADYDLDVPGEGYQGWCQVPVPIDLETTALVVMHAWDCGTRDAYPGWYRAVEYIPRAEQILQRVFPPLLAATRAAGVPVIHVASGDCYAKRYPGYAKAKALAGPEPPPPAIVTPDQTTQELQKIRQLNGMHGPHNEPDIQAGFARIDFPAQAMPVGDELVATDAHLLDACCRFHGAKHLIYVGFAINWCLVMSPGSMLDMKRRGYTCSTIREATTAVENRESARDETHKEEALWRVAQSFGVVFDLADLLTALAPPS